MAFGEEFEEILGKMREISDKKNSDYASDEDPFKNFRLCEAMGIPAWIGVLVRLGDKYSRLCEFASKEELKVEDESIEDTLIDSANYSVIALMLYREYKKAKAKPETNVGCSCKPNYNPPKSYMDIAMENFLAKKEEKPKIVMIGDVFEPPRLRRRKSKDRFFDLAGKED